MQWAGEYLFIGDSGGRVRAFNMRGDAVFTQQLLELPILQMEVRTLQRLSCSVDVGSSALQITRGSSTPPHRHAMGTR